MIHRFFIAFVITLGFAATADHAQAQEAAPARSGKPFKRALVISGGGVSPGISLGIMAGAEAAGFKPDVVITTCGAAIGASIRHAYPTANEALQFGKSRRFQTVLRSLKVEMPSIFQIRDLFEDAKKNSGIPPFFDRSILSFPQEFSGYIERNQFHVPTDGGPRIVIVAARLNFGPDDVGSSIRLPGFTQVYFTDTDTGRHLTGLPSSVHTSFPDSYIAANTEVITQYPTEKAIRASIADPFLFTPGIIDGQHYMTGAVDLFPIQTALALADEVVATYPLALYAEYEDYAISRTFGFSQNDAAIHAIQHKDVKWIDVTGMEKVTFDPSLSLLTLKDRVPDEHDEFQTGMQAQIDLGYTRVQEALRVQKDRNDVRTHLRKPINPKLIEGFNCHNAYVWSTPGNSYCKEDWWPNCDRNHPYFSCTVIR